MDSERKIKAFVGVAQAQASVVYFSAEPTGSFGLIAVEGLEPKSPQEINESVLLRRELQDFRPSYVVVEGREAFLQKYMEELSEPDLVVLCGEDRTLQNLGLPIVDKDWDTGHSSLTLDHFLRQATDPHQD